MAAKGQLLNQHLQTLAFINRLPDSDFKSRALQQTQAAILRATDPASESSPANGTASVSVSPGNTSTESAPMPEEHQCTVCHNMIRADSAMMTTPCSHTFHFACLRPWMQLHNTCPTCRQSMDGPIINDVEPN